MSGNDSKTSERVPSGAARSSLWSSLYNGRTTFDFAGRWKRWFVISGVLIVVGLGSLVTRGLDLGIDFEGGTVWEVKASGVSVPAARDAVRPLLGGQTTVQIVGGDTIRVKGQETTGPERDRVAAALAELASADVDQVNVNFVGPSWGEDVTAKAQRALVVFFILIAGYISLRFEWKMAAAALLAVVHDIAVTVGVYSLFGFPVTPATVIAFLTILGYSLYDTIVVFDKIEENVKTLGGSGRLTYTDVVNRSMNLVLMRTLNTSLSSVLPVVSLLVLGAGVLGATTLGDFGLALLIGMITGSYSSIFIAAPALALLKEREPRFTQIRERLEARPGSAPGASGGRDRVLTPKRAPTADAPREMSGVSDAAVPVAAGTAARTAVGGAAKTPAASSASRPAPRPRKQGKRR